MKREKRLKKGIELLREQIVVHRDKLHRALDEGNEELVEYYEKDLTRLENEARKKKEQLEKS